MTIGDPQLVAILVFVIAGLFLLQTLLLLVFFDQVNRRVLAAERSLIKLSKRVSQGLRLSKEYLHRLSLVTVKLPAVEHEINNVLDIALGKARQTNEIASRNIRLSIAHIEETGRRIELALMQFTRQTTKVKKWIRYPAYHISAIIHGAFAGIRVYSRESHRGQPATHVPDDEIFI